MSTAADCYFCELVDEALISFSGEDALSFLHAQLTSDVASIGSSRTQYSGYCSPKGRLLATCLLWPRENEILMLLPAALREGIQTRLAKYVLRARVRVTDATADYAIYGVAGDHAPAAVASLCDGRSGGTHEIVVTDALACTRLSTERYLLLVPRHHVPRVREALLAHGSERDARAWAALDVGAGVPIVTPLAQEQYVPQMVNLDLLGGVSYSKGCYPGQEIVARTHYLGKLKQRMYRVSAAGEMLRIGDALFSPEFGPDQASGAILYGSEGVTGTEALAVLRTSTVESGAIHLKSLEGPRIEVLSLPYPIPV